MLSVRKHLPTFLLALVLSPSHAEPTQAVPEVSPDGWIADYGYGSDVTTYLRQQHESARNDGLTLYVYFYDDLDPHCLEVRKLLRVDYVQDAFHGARIFMLDFERLRQFYENEIGDPIDPLSWSPRIVKIASNGSGTTTIIDPDIPLYHLGLITDPKLHRLGTNKFARQHLFARLLKEFFEENNEN